MNKGMVSIWKHVCFVEKPGDQDAAQEVLSNCAGDRGWSLSQTERLLSGWLTILFILLRGLVAPRRIAEGTRCGVIS